MKGKTMTKPEAVNEVPEAEAALAQAEITLMEARVREAESTLAQARAAHAQSTQLGVLDAEATIAAAKAEQIKTRRRELIAQLRVVRAELRVLLPELDQMRRDILDGQSIRDNLHRALSIRQDRVNDLHAEEPATANYLPDDPDVTRWRAALKEAEEVVVTLHGQIREQPNLERLRVQGVELQQRVQGLQYREANTLTALDALKGRGHASWGGAQIPVAGGTLSGAH
jgi:chromosome segregation ATPase